MFICVAANCLVHTMQCSGANNSSYRSRVGQFEVRIIHYELG